MTTLIEQVIELIQSDDENIERQSEFLEDLYKQATPAQKQAIDDAFICLCGWSLKTILAGQAY